MQRSEDRARLGCGPDATALPDVIHFCAPCLFTDEVEILRYRNASITGMSSASRALGSTLRLIFPFPFFAVTTQSRTEGRDQPSSEGAAMGWLTGWRPGVLVSVQLRKSAGNPLKCLLMDNTGGGGKPRTAVREGLLLRGSNHSVLGTVRPSPAGWVPDEGERKGRHPPKWGGWWSTSSGHVHLLTHVLSVHSPPYNPKGTDAKVDHTCWGELRPPISFLHLLP